MDSTDDPKELVTALVIASSLTVRSVDSVDADCGGTVTLELVWLRVLAGRDIVLLAADLVIGVLPTWAGPKSLTKPDGTCIAEVGSPSAS